MTVQNSFSSIAGGTLLPIIFHRLQPKLGFPWATRVLAFIILGTLCVPLAVMKVRVHPPQRRKFMDFSAWKDPAYDLYVLGNFVAFMGVWTPFFYVGLYALELRVTSADTAIYLLCVIAAGSVFGRLGPNYLSAKIGLYNVLVPCTILTGILAFCFIHTRSLWSIVLTAVLYGIFSGALVSIAPTICLQLSPNRALI